MGEVGGQQKCKLWLLTFCVLLGEMGADEMQTDVVLIGWGKFCQIQLFTPGFVPSPVFYPWPCLSNLFPQHPLWTVLASPCPSRSTNPRHGMSPGHRVSPKHTRNACAACPGECHVSRLCTHDPQAKRGIACMWATSLRGTMQGVCAHVNSMSHGGA